MQNHELTLVFEPASDFSLDEWEDMLSRARQDLQDSGIPHSVTRATQRAPDGAKSGLEAWLPATLLVSASPILIRALSGCVETWLKNRIVRNIRVKVGETELQLSHVSAQRQQDVLQMIRDALQQQNEKLAEGAEQGVSSSRQDQPVLDPPQQQHE